MNNIRTVNILEASKFLGAHKETIRRLAASGHLPGVKIGRSWRFIEDDLLRYMRAQYTTKQEQIKNSIKNCRSNTSWQSESKMIFGGLTLPIKDQEYAKALGLK